MTMTSEIATISKIREQVMLFQEVLNLEYNVPIRLSYAVYDKSDTEKIETIIKVVSENYQIPVPVLRRKGRKREVVEARQIAYYLIHNVFKLTKSLKEVALWFGGQHHSTVIHGLGVVEDLRDTSKAYAFELKAVTEICEMKIGTP